MCKEVNIINLCSRFNLNRLDCRLIHHNRIHHSLFLRMMQLPVNTSLPKHYIGTCRHHNARKYIPNIRLARPLTIYFVFHNGFQNVCTHPRCLYRASASDMH